MPLYDLLCAQLWQLVYWIDGLNHGVCTYVCFPDVIYIALVPVKLLGWQDCPQLTFITVVGLLAGNLSTSKMKRSQV